MNESDARNIPTYPASDVSSTVEDDSVTASVSDVITVDDPPAHNTIIVINALFSIWIQTRNNVWD